MLIFSQTIFSKDGHDNIVYPTVPSAMWSCHCLNKKWTQIWMNTDSFDQYSLVETTLVSILSKALKWLKSLSLNHFLGLTLLIIFSLSVPQAISRILHTKAKCFVYLKFKFKWVSYICFCWIRQPYLEANRYNRNVINMELPSLRPNWVARAWKMRHHLEREKTKEQ